MGTTVIEVGAVDDFPAGRFKILTLNGIQVGMVRLANGEFRAVRNHCPHRGAPICRGKVTGTWLPSDPGQLEYAKDGKILVCPWHGYEFDLDDGREYFQKRPARLRMYEVTVQRGVVTVTI